MKLIQGILKPNLTRYVGWSVCHEEVAEEIFKLIEVTILPFGTLDNTDENCNIGIFLSAVSPDELIMKLISEADIPAS